MRLTDRYLENRAFVTGAASGLGRALCIALGEAGWTIGMADVDHDALQDAAVDVRKADGQPMVFELDVTDAEAFGQAAADFVRRAGGAELVINNAGIAAAGPMEDVPLDDWKAVLDVNLMGVVHGCRAFIPYMKDARQGHLVNVASIAAVAAAPRMAPYNAAKAAVLALSETLYGELAEHGVHVSVVLPSFFKTNIGKSLRGGEGERQLTERMLEASGLTADTVARTTLDQVGRDKIHVVYPGRAKLIWHFRRLLPTRYVRSLTRMARSSKRFVEQVKGNAQAGDAPSP